MGEQPRQHRFLGNAPIPDAPNLEDCGGLSGVLLSPGNQTCTAKEKQHDDPAPTQKEPPRLEKRTAQVGSEETGSEGSLTRREE